MMGNNQMVLLQFPSTHYFFASTWDHEYTTRSPEQILKDISELLYPHYKAIIANSFLALQESEPRKIKEALYQLQKLLASGDLGKPGALGRFLFPDRLVVARDLAAQLRIRYARQNFIYAMQGRPDVNESAHLVEDFFNELLAWNQATGWDKLMDEGSATPIYDAALLRECGCQDKDLLKAMSRLKDIVVQGNTANRYAQINAFFESISKSLLQRYSESSVMIGCVEPFKLAVIQTP
jgi:hypothetical protein